MELTDAQRELLPILVEDGWPLVFFADWEGRDLSEMQEIVVPLAAAGLVAVWGRGEVLVGRDAEGVVSDPESWSVDARMPAWMLCISQAGAAFLQTLNGSGADAA